MRLFGKYLKRFSLVAAFMVAVAVSTAFFWLLPPSIQFAHETWNAGVVARGQPIKHTFHFRNRGIRPLVITDVVGGCNCATALLGKESTAHREGTEIAVTIRTDSFEEGPITKTILVSTNDPRKRSVRLQIQALVESEIQVSAYFVAFGPGEESREVRLKVKHNRNIECVAARAESGVVSARLERETSDGSEYRVTVSRALSANSAMTKLIDTVVVSTTSAATPIVTIPVFAVAADSELGLLAGAAVPAVK